MKSAYPELPQIATPRRTNVSLEESVHHLLSTTDECNARAVYAIMVAEASKTEDRKAFNAAGEYNYSGVQTDSGRWNYSTPIISTFRRIDVGGNDREFAGFKNNEGFFDFMSNRIKAKEFDGCNADNWTNTYIQKWWSPKDKAQYTQGTEKYNAKKSIFNTAIKQFDEFKKTYKGKPKSEITNKPNIGFVIIGIFLTISLYLLYTKRKMFTNNL